MANPYGPKIETVVDWNVNLACCCHMPEPPTPIQVCEALRANAYYYGYRDSEIEPESPLYMRSVLRFSGVDAFVETRELSGQGYHLQLGGFYLNEVTEDITDNGGTGFGRPTTTTYFSGISKDAARAASWSAVSAAVDFENEDYYKYGSCDCYRYDSRSDFWSPPYLLIAQFVRYRWQVPVSHLGTYYKVTWDVLYQPVGWDDMSIPVDDRPVQFSLKDLTVEWEGPGTGIQTDESWWAGDWQILNPPEPEGASKIINVRFEHLRKEEP